MSSLSTDAALNSDSNRSKSPDIRSETPSSTLSPSCSIHMQNVLYSKYNTATWMHDIYKHSPSVRLNQLVIPGSHDSATDKMTKNSMYAKFNKLHRVSPQLVYTWAKTQHHSIHEQLMDGIRYLDLRIENHPTGWKTFHGLISNCFIEVIDEIAKFANEYRREIILVDFQHLVSFEFQDHIDLIEYCIKHPVLGPRLAGNHFGVDGTFLDFWQGDRNVIIFYNEGFFHFSHLFWKRCCVENPWHNTAKSNLLHERLINGIACRSAHKFYVSQMILTPDAYRVVSGFWSEISSLYNLTIPAVSNLINENILEQLDAVAQRSSTHLNIVIVDFYEHSSFIERCLDINVNNLAKPM